MPHHEYAAETQAKLKALHEVIEQKAAELAILEQKNPNGDRNPSEGDPCGRSCEGQAYRIEARTMKAELEQAQKRIAELERLNLSFAQNEQKLSQCHTLMAESVIATYAKDGIYRVTIGVENSEKMHSLIDVLDSIAAADTQ